MAQKALYDHAGFALRLGAFFVDMLIFVFGVMVLASFLSVFGLSLIPEFTGSSLEEMLDAYRQDSGRLRAYNLTLTALNILYYSYFESNHKQATPGKQLMKIMVVNSDGSAQSLPQALIRNAGKIVSQLIMFFGYFMCLFTRHRQCLHDLLSNSFVIKNPNTSNTEII